MAKDKPHIRLCVTRNAAMWYAKVYWKDRFQYTTKIWLEPRNVLTDVRISERLIGRLL